MKLYFAALVLPNALNEAIQVFKNLMRDRWGCSVALKSPAHITLIPPFWMDETLTASLQHDLDNLCSSVPPFSVTMHHFSAFKPRTIFIEPVLHEPLKKLKETVDLFCKTHVHYSAKPDARPFHPHITIATRDLHKAAFAEAWAYFKSKKYEATFEATGISVLRHNAKTWDVIHTAPFAAT